MAILHTKKYYQKNEVYAHSTDLFMYYLVC